MMPTLTDIRAAAMRIAPHVHRTPVVTSRTLDDEIGASIFFKCENLQKVGAFKARGATNAVMSLDDDSAAKGVTAHSSGNHAAALAYAASIRGVPCTVVMPDSAPQIKIDAVRGYGAEIVFCKQAERTAVCDRVVEETGAILIHPYADPRIIAGQGTAALELLEEVRDLDAVIAPVGGGGLLSGTAIVVKSLRPQAIVYGAEPKAVDDAYRSLESGVRQPAVENPHTLADGLLTGLGELNFEILQARRARVVTVTEEAIVEAARYHLERMKLVVEPSGAVGLAALREIVPEIHGMRVGIVISGGNTDFQWLQPQPGVS
jgi:threonine dehydratase